MNKRFLLAAFCSGMISTALLNGCGLLDERPHSKTDIEEFVTDIDKDATVDYKSREKLTIWGRPYYSYDAVIGGINCQVLDVCYYKDAVMNIRKGYTLETNYPYKLCEELWNDVSEDYPGVDDIKAKNDDPELRLAYESVGDKFDDVTRVDVEEKDDEMTEELFDEYWDFYCDLMGAMEDYPEYKTVSLTITHKEKNFYIVFYDTDEEVYEEEYEKLFGDN